MPAMVEDLRKMRHADPDWFREPTRREHQMGGFLFLGFGAFFFLLFPVLAGWWFRWVMLMLGVWSAGRGVWHFIMSTKAKDA
jgi:hypothetical protein